MNIFYRLRKERTGYTQVELENLLGFSKNQYCRIESGASTPSISSLIKLADFYGVSLDFLAERKFDNGVGYISDLEKELLHITKKLNDRDIGRVIAYATGRIDTVEEIKYENKWGNKNNHT